MVFCLSRNTREPEKAEVSYEGDLAWKFGGHVEPLSFGYL